MDVNRMRDIDSRLDRRLNRRFSNNMVRNPQVSGMKRTSNRGRRKKVSTPDSDVSVDPESDLSMEPDLLLFLRSFRSLDDLSNGDDGVNEDDGDDEYVAVDDDDGYKAVNEDDYAEYMGADEDNSDCDLDYVTCLKNLREFGTAYILEVIGNDGRSMCVKYEEDDEFSDDRKRKSSKKVIVAEVPSKDKVKGHEKTHWRKIRSQEKDNPPAQQQCLARDPKFISKRGRKKKDIEKDVKVEHTGTAVPKPGPQAHNLSPPKAKHAKQVFGEDQNYTYFLNTVKLDGDSLVFKTEHGDLIRYESDDESASDSDIEIAGVQFLEERHTPFVLSNGSRIINCHENSKRTSSEYMEKLMDILVKPFDKNEYDELLHEISERKPMEKHIDFRGNSTRRCILLESVGKSYLDHHADFKRRLEAVRLDRHKVLNLLRGFFYWLKNIANNNAFRPWLDETCLKVLPGR